MQWRRLLIGSALALLLVVLVARPAEAHGPGGGAAGNYETRLTSVEPTVPGVTLTVIETGDRLQLTNETDQDVIVLGYEGEPYLRVGSDGVFENTRSPATYLNQNLTSDVAVPATADPTAEPEWRKVSSGTRARWHDHRAHWMGTNDPPQVEQAPNERHVVIEDFEIPMRHGDDDIVATGDVLYVPPPSPLLWFVLATAVCVGGGLIGLTRWWRVAGCGLVVLVLVTASISALGIGFLTPGSTSERLADTLGDSVYVPVLLLCAVVAIVMVARDHPFAPGFLILVGAVGAFFGGLLQAPMLTNSVVPSALSSGAARLTTSLTLGFGAALVALGAARLLREPGGQERAPEVLDDEPGELADQPG
jgi:hypothetical protein